MTTYRGKALLFGGWDAANLADTWTFDGTSWSEVTTTHAAPGRFTFAMAPIGDEVVIYGGLSVTTYLDDTWVFNGTAWTQNGTPGPSARCVAAMGNIP
jgi:hypothetical protein